MPSLLFLSRGRLMEQQNISLKALIPVIREVLASGGEFSLKPRGISMLPYLREGRDTIILSPLKRPPKRGDVLLYVRDTGAPVLHRVVRIERDGTLSMRGDNQYYIEKGIRLDQVVAIMERFFRHGRKKRTSSFSSRLYRARRTVTYPVRRVYFAILHRLQRLSKGGRS